MELIISNPEDIAKISEALSSITRVKILKLIGKESLGVTEISEILKMSKGNISSQISLLESLGLVEISYGPGIKGLKKLVKLKYDKIIIDLSSQTTTSFQETDK
ncbi:MAG: winged helix-turn-helix domain-containing protein [Sulfolobaceae archaeon]